MTRGLRIDRYAGPSVRDILRAAAWKGVSVMDILRVGWLADAACPYFACRAALARARAFEFWDDSKTTEGAGLLLMNDGLRSVTFGISAKDSRVDGRRGIGSGGSTHDGRLVIGDAPGDSSANEIRRVGRIFAGLPTGESDSSTDSARGTSISVDLELRLGRLAGLMKDGRRNGPVVNDERRGNTVWRFELPRI